MIYKFLTILFSTAIILLFASMTASATVISIGANGEYSVQETTDYRLKASPLSKAPSQDDAPGNTQSADDTPSRPFVARIMQPETDHTDETSPDLKPPSQENIILDAVERNTAIDAALLHAVIATESNYNPLAVSNKGAMGLMQLMPDTAKSYDVVNAFDPEENITAGAAELDRLMKKYNNVALALAAYNAGQGAVGKYDGIPPYPETQDYVIKVLSKTFEEREKKIKAGEPLRPETKAKKSPHLRPMKVYSFD